MRGSGLSVYPGRVLLTVASRHAVHTTCAFLLYVGVTTASGLLAGTEATPEPVVLLLLAGVGAGLLMGACGLTPGYCQNLLTAAPGYLRSTTSLLLTVTWVTLFRVDRRQNSQRLYRCRIRNSFSHKWVKKLDKDAGKRKK